MASARESADSRFATGHASDGCRDHASRMGHPRLDCRIREKHAMKRQSGQHPKINAELIGEFHGLTIYGRLDKAKRSGKDRIWKSAKPLPNPMAWLSPSAMHVL